MSIQHAARAALVAVALAMSAATAAIAFDAKSTAPINIDKAGVALRGYDPVAYFTAGKPTAGSAAFQTKWDGATYNFATAESKAEFDKDPAKYAPQYGGFCAWAAANGYKADADPKAWHVVGGKLYVNYNASVSKSWNANTAKYITDADKNWPKVATQLPK